MHFLKCAGAGFVPVCTRHSLAAPSPSCLALPASSTADIDGDGTLDVAEIASYMKRLYNFDEKMAEEQANKFLKEVDVDNVRLCIR